MQIKIFNENIAEQNSYLIIKGKEAVVIDPGFNGEMIASYLDQEQIILTDVLLTHGHFDHIRDLMLFGNLKKLKVHLHEADKDFLHDDKLNYAKAFHSRFLLPENMIEVIHKDGDLLSVLDEKITVIHTPGHTGGSVSYHLNDRLFTGDTLFMDGIGRTDLYGGSMKAMRESIQKITTKFSRKTKIYPGHGDNGLLQKLLEHNPYL
jgi:glyoxylase-like metal-dependent hydrolase (beta-lactamase superfamily II)